MVAATEFPELTVADQEDLIALAKRADVEDRPPSDANWEPTWDLDAAAAEGWRRKAGKVASRFSVNIDGDALQRAQVFSHCLAMADRYGRKMVRSAEITTTPNADYLETA